MKTTTKVILGTLLLLLSMNVVRAQQGANEFESNRIYTDLAKAPANSLATALNGSDDDIFKNLKTLFDPKTCPLTGVGTAPDLPILIKEISSALTDIENPGNAAVIVVFRPLTGVAAGNSFTFTEDFTKTTVKVLHNRSKTGDKFSGYLLATKTVYFVLVDLNDDYYELEPKTKDNKLSNLTTKVNYRTGMFKQSFLDLQGVIKAQGGNVSTSLRVTLIKMNPARIKDPCDIVASHPKFQNDQTFTIHERNVATFQVGVTGSNIALNNVSIANGDLTVKPSAGQAKSWQSNAYALLEVHLPRDVDNFRPILQSLFSSPDKNNPRDVGQWFAENILDRIGVYGGAKISKDPLSSLYSGFNFALSKQLALNFGWEWVNDYATQVTDIGSITSLSDALKYAKREYSGGKFSIGISFAPSYFTTLIGAKSKSADSGN